MFSGTRYILNKLNDPTISLENKNRIFKFCQYIIAEGIKKLSAEELLKYLYNSKLDREVKKIIFKEIVELKSSYFSSDKEKYKSMKQVFADNYVKESLLNSEFCHDDFKSIIIDKVFDEDLTLLISKNTISNYKKKVIIDIKFKDSLDKLLELNLSDEIVNYIIDNKLKKSYSIASCLNNKTISQDIKKEIINRCINTSNVFSVNHSLYYSSGFDLLEERRDLVEEIYNQINSLNIFDYFTDYNVPKDFRNRLHNKKEIIKMAIENADEEKIKDAFFSSYDSNLCNMIFNTRADVISNIVDSLKDVELLPKLNKMTLPDEFKAMVINKHRDRIIKVIKNTKFDELKTYYLSYGDNLPEEVVKYIISFHYDSVIDYVNNIPDNELFHKIKYSSECREIEKLILIYRFDDNKIFDFLSKTSYLDSEVVDFILDTRPDCFTNYLKGLEFRELFELKEWKFPSEIKDKILMRNRDILLEKINEFSTNEKFELLNNEDVNLICKSLLIESLSIDTHDVNDFLVLLSHSKAEELIDNFNMVKDFINDNNINFKSLLQYGAGSEKHSLWLNELVQIMLKDDSEDFIKCKNYFFDNYYVDLLDKENTVYEIDCFLEMIDNYSKYKDLMHSIVDNNVVLDSNDKSNLKFLFNVNSVDGIDVPKTLEDLSEFKLNLYSDYIDRINNGLLNEEAIKNIFNDLLFCDSKIVLDSVGGTGALRVLKKDNCNNGDIVQLIDDLMLYGRVIEMVNDSNNISGLKGVLKHVFSDVDTLTKFQNLFADFKDKISKLYEMDSSYNLTTIDEARSKGFIDFSLSDEYGGEVFDFSDKNYALYAHILSRNESIEDLLNGVSSGDMNFISVSPISYRGQSYYWGRDEMIFAYDKIPNGSFVRSSISNMGSNGFINKNSSEIGVVTLPQRGILETSSATSSNAEALLYREGLTPCGLILPNGRKPTSKEREIHNKYNLPFIVTQPVKKPIENVKYLFKDKKVDKGEILSSNQDIIDMIDLLEPKISISKENEEFTGREIALFTDCHSMFEPTIAVLDDIRRHGIKEIYSLGDNVGLGPNPCEVFDLLEEYGVISIAGNSEYYSTLGIGPFDYFYDAKIKSQEWTEKKLGTERIKKLKVYPASVDLVLGGKKLALCHFANDVRWDYRERSTHTYQANYNSGNASEQFLYTNSDLYKTKINNCIISHKKGDPRVRGYVSSRNEPLFDGKLVTDYDAIIQGHVHFDREDRINETDIHTLRAVGMGYENDSENTACYYVLKEKKDGSFEKEKRLVKFNRNNLLASINNSDIPNKEAILRYVKK